MEEGYGDDAHYDSGYPSALVLARLVSYFHHSIQNILFNFFIYFMPEPAGPLSFFVLSICSTCSFSLVTEHPSVFFLPQKIIIIFLVLFLTAFAKLLSC